MRPDGLRRTLAVAAALLMGATCASDAAENTEQGPARGGIRIDGEQSVADALVQGPRTAAVPRKKRKRGPGHADDLRTQGDLRRDTFRLLLGGR